MMRARAALRSALVVSLQAGLLACLLPPCTTRRLDAQASRPLPPATDSLYRESQRLLSVGDTSSALDLLKQVEQRAPRFAQAIFDHGVILSRRSEMGLAPDDIFRRRLAGQQLEKALDLDRGNPLYLLELGRLRLKTPFLRIEAERLFARAQRSARDRGDARVLAAVEHELGLISSRRFNAMRNRRILTGSTISFDIDAAANDWHYVRDFLDQRTAAVADAGAIDALKADDHFRAVLAADSSHAPAAADLLGLLYETGRVDEMLPLAQALARRQSREPRTWMALGLALHRLDRLEEASIAFDSALILFPDSTRRELLDITQWLRPDDAAHLATVPAAERRDIENAWWRTADPLALTPVNEARVGLLARVAYVDLRFTSDEARIPGWRTDRGQVWIRYGAPGEIASLAPETQEVHSAESLARVITIWWYPRTSMRFVFRGPPAMNVAGFAGNFRAYTDNARRIIPMQLDDVNSAMRLDTVPVQVARFRGDSLVRVELFASFPTNRMLADVDLSPALVETGFAFDAGAARVAPRMLRDTLRVRSGRAAVASRVSWVRNVTPGSEYAFRIEARQPDTGRGARGEGTLGVVPMGRGGAFDISDMIVADRIAAPAEAMTRAAYRIDANPALLFSQRDTVALYWETYNATARPDGAARLLVQVTVKVLSLDRGPSFTARILGGIADAVGLSAVGNEQVSLTFERSVGGASSTVPHQLALGMGDAPAGRYLLALDVTDLASGRRARTERTITLERPSP
ncbi:MAG: GWxTD domain-containing protein [Gemmatimonadota bacterium]